MLPALWYVYFVKCYSLEDWRAPSNQQKPLKRGHIDLGKVREIQRHVKHTLLTLNEESDML